MTYKREPYQGSVKANSANNDDIIELTDEVAPKPEADAGKLERGDDLNLAVPKTDAKEDGSKVDDDLLNLDDQDDFEPQKDDVFFGLTDEDDEYDSNMEDNEIIASAIEESFGFEEEEDFTPTDELKLKDPDDEDVIIVDNAPLDEDGGLAAKSGEGGADTQKEDDIFDLEKGIEIEYELDDDEDEMIPIDDERGEDDQNFVSMVFAETGKSKPADRSEAPTEYNHLGQGEPVDMLGFEADDGDDLLALDEDLQEVEEIADPAKEEALEFAEGGDLLDLHADDEIIALDGTAEFDDEKNEDIIEITEFDHHFSEEGETLFEQTGLLKTSHPEEEEDFLELIDLEDDSPAQDENMTDFVEAAEKIEYAAVNRFFNEALEEDRADENLTKPSVYKTALAADEAEREAADPFFTEALNQEPDSGDYLAKDETEIFYSGSDLKTQASRPSSEDERFDFDSQPGAIAQQVDRLDAFLSEGSSTEPEAAPLPAEQADGALPITPGQLDAAIARVISEKFSGKIENIIYEVIEKAVSKEIEHLKGVLLGNTLPDEDQ